MKLRPRLFMGLLVAVGALGNGCPTAPPSSPPDPTGSTPKWDASRFPWPMYGQNVRRTGQSPFNGPASANPASPTNWKYTATAGAAINMQAVATNRGVFFGTWGLSRRDLSQLPDQWDKADGRYYGLFLENRGSDAAQKIFAPLLPAKNPAGYLDPNRPRLGRDVFWLGVGNNYLVTFYNGTVEGTPVIDPDDGTHYLGRGDGNLYAVNPDTGQVKWIFKTFNPQQSADAHDVGGEIIGGPVMGPGKIIYFGTIAAPWPGDPGTNPVYETNAVYAVDTLGRLVWRYPAADATLDNWILTPPALSPDGKTLYLASTAGDPSVPGTLYAFDLAQPAGASDAQRLKWKMTLRNDARSIDMWVNVLAVDANGVIYCGGAEPQILSSAPVIFAVRDMGDHAQMAWPAPILEPQGYPSSTAQLCHGLAIREDGANTQTLFATTTHVGRNNGDGGMLFAINPADGSVRHGFQPQTAGFSGVGGLTAPTLGANGNVYLAARGKIAAGANPAVDGRAYGLSYNPATGFSVLWEFQVTGQIDWAHPIIGGNGALYFGSTDAFGVIEQALWYGLSDVPPNLSPRFYAIFE